MKRWTKATTKSLSTAKKIPAAKLDAAATSSNPTVRALSSFHHKASKRYAGKTVGR